MVAANRADLAFALQSAKGSPASASSYRTRLTGGRQPGQMRSNAPFEETTGERMYEGSYASESHVEGSPSLMVMPASFTALLYGVLGAISTTGAGDPYTHEITPASSLPYWTFWRWISDLIMEE